MSKNVLDKMVGFIFSLKNKITKEKLDFLVKTLFESSSDVLVFLAPAIPASMTFFSTQKHFEWGLVRALVFALIVEIIGISSFHYYLKFKRHNDKYRYWNKKRNRFLTPNEKRAPIRIPFFISIFYSLFVVFLNVILEQEKLNSELIILAKVLAVSLSVPGILLSVAKNQYSEIVSKIEKENSEKEKPKKKPRKPKSKPVVKESPEPVVEWQPEIFGGASKPIYRVNPSSNGQVDRLTRRQAEIWRKVKNNLDKTGPQLAGIAGLNSRQAINNYLQKFESIGLIERV